MEYGNQCNVKKSYQYVMYISVLWEQYIFMLNRNLMIYFTDEDQLNSNEWKAR